MLFTLQLDKMWIFTDYDRQILNVCVLINLNQFVRGNLCHGGGLLLILLWIYIYKHCQRHNGPEGWVQLTKVTCLSHITSSRKDLDQDYLQNLDQASTSKIRPNISISSKLKTSKSWPNLASESRPRFNFITSTKHQRQNAEQTPASKSCLNFNFKILTNPCAQSLNKSLALGPNVSFQICNKLLPTRSSSSTSTTVTTSTSFELPSSHATVTSIKFTKQQLVS